MSPYPTQDSGHYHLTRTGWVRKDGAPFPADRIETWSYSAECPADDAKEQVCLKRIWKARELAEPERDCLRNKFGMPIGLQTGRNITFECEV